MSDGPACRVRLVAFAGQWGQVPPATLTIPLVHCADFIERHMRAALSAVAEALPFCASLPSWEARGRASETTKQAWRNLMEKKAGITFQAIVRQLRKRNFAVPSTADQQGRPHCEGVVYGVSPHSADLYVMTRRHLKKARNISANPNVSLVVPLTWRLLWFLPPPCIQFQAKAEILDRTDPIGAQTFRTFLMGRRILTMYEDVEQRGDSRTCFLRITPEPVVSTYMMGAERIAKQLKDRRIGSCQPF